MKVIYKFDYYDDKEELKTFSNAIKMLDVLAEYRQWLRNALKHNPSELSQEVLAGIDLCREQLIAIMQEENLDLN